MDALMLTVLASVASGVIAGGVSTWGTVKALQVHIDYLNAAVKRHDEELIQIRRRLQRRSPYESTN